MLKIKVCGLTRPSDAVLAARLGADFAGMIFFRRSPRFVTIGQARKIVKALPPVVNRVGVFVNEDVERILTLAARLRLDWVQLHGDEPARDIVRLQKNNLKVIKAFRISERGDYRPVLSSGADLVLFDNALPDMPGGTGKRFDWTLKPPRRFDNVVLAGGVDVANLSEGIRRFRPLVVDVNSGVETSPGIKSPVKMRAFFKKANGLRYGQ